MNIKYQELESLSKDQLIDLANESLRAISEINDLSAIMRPGIQAAIWLMLKPVKKSIKTLNLEEKK